MSQSYEATIYANGGVRILSGTVIASSDSSVTFRYKRPRSSKFEQTVVPRSQIIYLAVGDESSEIGIAELRQEVESVKISGKVTVNGNLVEFVSENGDAYSVDSRFIEIVGEASDEAPAKKKVKEGKEGKKKAKKAKKG